ncbi:MAG: YggT family protein [Parachlamydiales bacterium]|jgi:YggT family protein
MLINLFNLFFNAYVLVLLARIIGSWFGSFQRTSLWNFIYRLTEPYLAFFRRFLPPVGGTLDLSPIIGFFVLKLLQKFILYLFR